MPRQIVNPSGVSKPQGYSHAVKKSGTPVFLSGQVALDADGKLVGAGDVAAQVEQVFQNVRTVVEWLCWLRAMVIPLNLLFGVIEWSRLGQLYALGVTIILMNQLRQMADHHFDGDGGNLEFADHIRDSCNYTGRDWLTWLFFPFAIRYHGLHHLFPTLPYHNLSAAHAWLMRELLADSPYRELDQPGWWSVARKMFQAQGERVFRGRPAKGESSSDLRQIARA